MSRDHGTRARYVMGEGPGKMPGCRCGPCTAANREYASHRGRQQVYGRWQPGVDAEPAREHLRALSAAGIGWKQAARLSGLSTGVVSKLLYGIGERPPTRRIRPATEQRILAIPVAAPSLARAAVVDATATRRRLQALVARGYSQAVLARRLGILRSNFSQITAGQVTAATERDVAGLYDQLWNVPPDESTHRSRISASRARNYARARGWVPPLAWDDDRIADPGAQPAADWRRPARVPLTALAEDVHEVIAWEGSRDLAARRLGVSRNTLDKAIERGRQGAEPAELEAG
jgi:transcriptional regulator with XRE-family HTH domain